MPIYEPSHVEHTITSGHIRIAIDDGTQLPAYWAHPHLGTKFPGVAIIHDWWGLTPLVRRVANWLAQVGHYVVVPDLFDGRVAETPQEAMQLIAGLGDGGYSCVHHALAVLENHHQCNRDVAVVGFGMGGSLAFEAAIMRDDLEVTVAYGGFPARYLGRLKDINTIICAFYGAEERHITAAEIAHLREELAQSSQGLPHELHVVEGLGHELFSDTFTQEQREISRGVLKSTLRFLDKHLEPPAPPRVSHRY